MPRPKVRLEDRRRAVKACVPCQNSKKRCDSETPCANCRRRDCIASCIYDPEAARPRRLGSKNNHFPAVYREQGRRGSTNTMTTAISNDDHSSLDHTICSDTMSSINVAHDQVRDPQTPESTQGPCSNATPDALVAPYTPNIRNPAQNLEGEKLSMGDSVSLSFLDFLRHTFLQYMGPSPFTDKESAKAMLESSFPLCSSGDISEGSPESHLSLEEKKDYIERFFIATTGLVYLYSPRQLLDMLHEREEAKGRPADQSDQGSSHLHSAVIDMAIAIGGQGCGTTPKSLYHAQRHFDRGQKSAFGGMLLDPEVDLIAVFLMMSIYMLCACKRKGAFIYLGVAARLAHAMGLHMPESYHHMPAQEQIFRAQIWKSLRILDIAFGAVFSQTPASCQKRSSDEAAFPVSDSLEPSPPEHLSMLASFGVCTILEQITHNLDYREDMSLASIKDLLSRLRDWSSSLPPSIRTSSVSLPLSSEQRRRTLGNFAVSCFYYYAVILATRPVLISHLLMKLGRLDPSATSTPSGRRVQMCETEEIAQVCVDASVLLVETTKRTQSVGLLIENMALLKAWLFSASLILGFSLFVDASLSEASPTFAKEAALHCGIGVIRELAQTSPQAHRYLDVLTKLRNALQKYRERLVPGQARIRGEYLSQIFVLNKEGSAPVDSGQDATAFTPSVVPPDLGAEPSGVGLSTPQSAAESTQGLNDVWKILDESFPFTNHELSGQPVCNEFVPMPTGGFDLHWCTVSVQGTDNYLFDVETFEGILN